ncbi:transcriptional regulator [Nocardia sp. NPDC059177]|uniref:transcriptional regulator n=1 Tax=Nocardia sp. NPDC059177 TaxID=3346759 RepID=UPI0036A25BF4
MVRKKGGPGAGPAFASRLNDLFARPLVPGEPAPTSRGVARALTERGQPLSGPYLSQLRSGQRENPAPAVVAALAAYFGVHPSHFAPATDTFSHPADLAVLTRLRCDRLRTLLVHAHHLPADSLDLMVRFAESLRASEGLSEDATEH